jgi:hypothetical protein
MKEPLAASQRIIEQHCYTNGQLRTATNGRGFPILRTATNGRGFTAILANHNGFE